MSGGLVVLATFPDKMSAELARGRLEIIGIDAYIKADDEGGLHPGMALVSGVKLLVNEIDLERAKHEL